MMARPKPTDKEHPVDEHRIFVEFCRPRFEALEKHNAEVQENVRAIREKVFNGYGSSIEGLREELKSLRGWIMGLIATVAVTVIMSMIKLVWL